MTVPVISFRAKKVVTAAIGAGRLVVVPDVGGYAAVVRADLDDASSRLAARCSTTSSALCHLIGSIDQARALAGDWSATTQQLMVRCWPGALTIVVPTDRAPGRISLRLPSSRPLRHLLRESGPWLVAPLGLATVAEVLKTWAGDDHDHAVACIVDGGHCANPTPTVVDATGPTLRTVEEGALPTAFIEGALLMGGRRRWFRSRVAAGDPR
jgi:tRNA A37 threonylcarbamoyladenosine synthetase subunit TsaC/SUA5/YrdC